MRRAVPSSVRSRAILRFATVAVVVATAGAGVAAGPSTSPPATPPPAASPPATPPVPSPFGPPWDPTRPAPVAPGDKGAGITAATVVATGPADIEELRGETNGSLPYFAVVLDVTLAADSTTAVLGATSVTLEREDGVASPLKALCTPTLEDAGALWRGGGGTILHWSIAVGGRTWRCGDRNASMAMILGDDGTLRLTAPAAADWKGPLVLLFEPRVEAARRVVLAGRRIDLAPADAPASGDREAPGAAPDGRVEEAPGKAEQPAAPAAREHQDR